MFKPNDLVTVNSGTTVFRIVEIDGDLAVLVRANGSCGEQTVNVRHLQRVETIKVSDMNKITFFRGMFHVHSPRGNFLASGYWANGKVVWIHEPDSYEERHTIECIVTAQYSK